MVGRPLNICHHKTPMNFLESQGLASKPGIIKRSTTFWIAQSENDSIKRQRISVEVCIDMKRLTSFPSRTGGRSQSADKFPSNSADK